ncbi:hypothetical protein CVE34_16485 [Pseudomonas syringae pv. actinidiae]|nr:hypothetical protein IYO_020745 [Pseudomonas syringae pv. actinidiae ICMP 18884]AOE58261.1 hypothetical protein NZ708_20725 [Pseudomonas syringae pv. actinidiae ICMP 18708]APP99213.1 hypothetical protein PsaNZ45_21275 [Pseudomonas syringae pv. actinidiae]AYL82448.1 hypothetical protein CN228_23395 [Pseudomonas syringae pv. actinidiae str. Shaanxi_M228]NAS99861.1 hypothetical protein [Pseudomonas syringae pv. actinidifoliorum]
MAANGGEVGVVGEARVGLLSQPAWFVANKVRFLFGALFTVECRVVVGGASVADEIHGRLKAPADE